MNLTSKRILVIGLLASVTMVACSDDDDDNNNLNDTDRNFVTMASISNNGEIQAGQLAASKATDASVKAFGQKMVADHTTAASELKAITGNLGLNVSDTLDAEHKALKAQLESLSGRSFDSVYIHSQTDDHTSAITLFQNEASNGSNNQLKTFAGTKIPVLQMHKQMADTIVLRFQ